MHPLHIRAISFHLFVIRTVFTTSSEPLLVYEFAQVRKKLTIKFVECFVTFVCVHLIPPKVTSGFQQFFKVSGALQWQLRICTVDFSERTFHDAH